MRNYAFILMFVFPAFFSGKPSGNPYAENIILARTIMDSATVEKSYVTAANYFERIAAMNSSEWLPHYYAAFCYTRASHLNTEAAMQDMWVDKAQAEIDKAMEMQPANAEVLILKGFVLQARMNINPMVRGFQYNNETMECFGKARAIDPENPRSYLWQGVNLLHTPEAFGGGKENACPLIRKALEKFAVFVPADSLAPDWGYNYAKEIIQECR
jgi:tetratricopeptide (TPR) repeat protein